MNIIETPPICKGHVTDRGLICGPELSVPSGISKISLAVLWMEKKAYTSSIHKHVNAAMVVNNIRHEAINFVFVAHINGMCGCLEAP